MEIDKSGDLPIRKVSKTPKDPWEVTSFNWEEATGMKEKEWLGSYQASWFLFKIWKMRNKGITTRTVVTVLTREESILCVMDERWFGCVYFHRLLLVNMHAQPCQFIFYSLHVVYRRANQGQGAWGQTTTRVGRNFWSTLEYSKGGEKLNAFPASLWEPSFQPLR